MMKKKCVNKEIKEVWTHCGYGVCTAVHPKNPNWSGNSRGRKIHLAKDEQLTFCNMLVELYIPDDDRNWAMVSNGRCKVCFGPKVVKDAEVCMAEIDNAGKVLGAVKTGFVKHFGGVK